MNKLRCFIILLTLLSTHSLFADGIKLLDDYEKICSKCGKTDIILWGNTCSSCRKCPKCGKETMDGLCSSCINRTLTNHNLYRTHVFDHKPRVHTRPIRTKSNGRYGGIAALLAPVIIGVGTFLFFDYPILGIIVIIIGLYVAYLYFKMKSENTMIPKRNNNSPQSTSTINSDSNRVQNEEKRKVSPGSSAYWFIEGVHYCTGKDGRTVNYQLAKECFQKSKSLGDKDAEKWLDYLKNISDS